MPRLHCHLRCQFKLLSSAFNDSPGTMVEVQLRAEMLTLKRSEASLAKRVSQLTGMLTELQPLWVCAPTDVQEQVQLAITAQTPRQGICASALGTHQPFPEASKVPVSVPPLRKSPISGMLAGARTGAHSFSGESDSDDIDEKATPLSTARHRLDDDDSAGEGEPVLGQVTASSEHYHSVLASLTSEIAARKSLEEEVAALRHGRDVELTTARPQTGLVAALERALEKGNAQRQSLRSCTDSLAAEWAWHKWPSSTGAGGQYSKSRRSGLE